MKTWAEQLEDALPKADKDFICSTILNYCPAYVFGKDAPECNIYSACSMDKECWNSCNSKCIGGEGEKDEK